MTGFVPLDRSKTDTLTPGRGGAARLGRFELRSQLGEGAQSTVWLAYDPRLERHVAIKLLKVRNGFDAQAQQTWLRETRSVGRLAHPHIVPLFEADIIDQQPFLVFEYVAGRTLAEHLRVRAALPAREAVELILGLLGALQEAHSAGIIHRDLKPSNILIDGQGHARLTDFGIATRLAAATASTGNPVQGTPAYMAPEAAGGAAPSAAMDVFSVGMVLAEMLLGRALVDETDPQRTLQRIAQEDLVLPAMLSAASAQAAVDDHLRGIVQQAIRRQPAQRHASAQALQQALSAWLLRDASTEIPDVKGAGSNQGTLDFLLRRMRHKSDFPALSDSVARIQRFANSDNESVGSLTNEILKDIALTNKLLRMVNTVHFSHAGGGSISTVSRAVALVGFNGIRNMALSLMLLDHMQDKAHANLLKEEFLRCLMAGSVASALCRTEADSEDAFIGAMFQNLGRLLTGYYFVEEAREVRALMSNAEHALDDHDASCRVLGLSFEDLGLGVARAWGLPDSLQRCMRRPAALPTSQVPTPPQERVHWIAVAANEVADTLLRSEPEHATARVAAVAQRYARTLGLQASEVQQATQVARQSLAQMAQAMQLNVMPGSPAQRLLHDPTATAESRGNAAQEALRATALEAVATVPVAPKAQQAQLTTDILVAGIQDITNTLVDNFKLNEVIRMILETMLRALNCQRIVFCLRDVKTESLTGRFGLGAGVEAVIPSFKVALKGGSDLFAVVCAKGADTLISDASDALIAARLPAWYRSQINAPTFVLLPLQLKGTSFAMIYADANAAGAIALDEKQLSLLRTLRNQAVMAFRQAG